MNALQCRNITAKVSRCCLGQSLLSHTPPLIIMQGVETGTRGGEQSSRAVVVVVVFGGWGVLDWGGSRGVTRTTTGDNPRTVPCDEALTANMAAHH